VGSVRSGPMTTMVADTRQPVYGRVRSDATRPLQ
jgi:hypothetical protein